MKAEGTWQKSSFSGGGDGNNCVEIRAVGSGYALREGDDPDGVLTVGVGQLGALIGAVKRSANPSSALR